MYVIDFWFLGKIYRIKTGETSSMWLMRSGTSEVWFPVLDQKHGQEMYSKAGHTWERVLLAVKIQLLRQKYGLTTYTFDE